MPPDERDLAQLWEMRDEAQRLVKLMAGGTRERFAADEMVQLAAERVLQNIGEAARRVSVEFRAEHPEIPWQEDRRPEEHPRP
jgi:uncharacterized protein with HEPN domain